MKKTPVNSKGVDHFYHFPMREGGDSLFWMDMCIVLEEVGGR